MIHRGKRLPDSRLVPCLLAALPLGAHAQTFSLPYGGRLTDALGAPVAGQVELEVSFYGSAEGGTRLARSPYGFPATATQNGVFNLNIDLSPADFATIFDALSSPVWIEVTDKSSGTTYPRQRIAVAPQAMRVPIDEAMLEFDATGRLTVKSVPSTVLQGKADVNVSL
jgi:hypothetical protein